MTEVNGNQQAVKVVKALGIGSGLLMIILFLISNAAYSSLLISNAAYSSLSLFSPYCEGDRRTSIECVIASRPCEPIFIDTSHPIKIDNLMAVENDYICVSLFRYCEELEKIDSCHIVYVDEVMQFWFEEPGNLTEGYNG